MNEFHRKSFVLVIILFFIAVSVVPTTGKSIINNKLIKHKNNEDSLNDWYFNLKIRSLMILGHYPSLSACIIKNDTVVWSNGYGWARPGKRPTSDTVYMVASISKSITATALLQLYEQGKFNLDDDVNKYLNFSIRNPNFLNDPITFRMLLAHQSSLNDNDQLVDGWFSLMMGFTSILNYPEYPYPRIKEYIVPNGSLYKKSIWMDKPPGEVTQYTNVGFMLLEHLFNCISGQSLEEYCRYNIFNPLNMMNTSFQLSYFDQKQIAIPYARLFLLKIPLPHFQLAHASSNLRTTCEDLSHFLIAHMNGGVYKGVRILNESTINLMHSVQYNNSHFGLGWDAINQGHGGSWLGCDSNMWIRNSNSTGLIFFMNKMVNTNIKSIFFAYKKITEELFLKANEF